MFTYVWVAISAVLAAGAASLAWAQARRVARTTVGDPDKLIVGLKRKPLEARPEALLELAAAGSWERGLAEELVAAKEPARRVVIANDALAELAIELEAGAGWPSAALRITGLTTVLTAVIAYLSTRELTIALGALVPGMVGAVVCLEASRRARVAAHSRRVAVDALVDTLMGPAARDAAIASNARRRRRREDS